MITRREFVKKTGTVAAISTLGFPATFGKSTKKNMKTIRIDSVDSNFEREPLIRPFGFKGGYMTEIWQTMSWMKSDSGINKVGLCTQNVLWSDANVFASHSKAGGNSLMYLLTERAMQIVKGQKFSSPVELLDNILDLPVQKFVTRDEGVFADPHGVRKCSRTRQGHPQRRLGATQSTWSPNERYRLKSTGLRAACLLGSRMRIQSDHEA